MKKNYTSKEITSKILSFQKVEGKELEISCDAVQYVPAKDVIELYLSIGGADKITWKDKNNSLPSHGFFTNIGNILHELLVFPFLYLQIKKLFHRIEKEPVYLSFPKDLKILYMRTDHWFNLTGGGSVGHVSGVVNELYSLGNLHTLITTDHLFEVFPSIAQQVVAPSYSGNQNIPELPALVYNEQLWQHLQQKELSANAIYQRLSLGNFVGVLWKYHQKIPLIIEYNASEIWASEKWGGRKLWFLDFYQAIEQMNLFHADLIVVVSAPLKEELIARGIASERILINPNGVNTEKYSPAIDGSKVRNMYSLENKKVFGFIGTFAEWHGVLFMVKSIVHFFEKYPTLKNDIRFLLIGSGNLLQESQKTIEQAGLSPQVVFTDRIPQSEAPRYLAACDYFLSPHIPNPDGTKFFGSPTKLFEYMAMRRPIIASDLDQIGEILKENNAAILITPNNIEGFVQALFDMQENGPLNHTLAENAYKAAIEKYSWNHHVKEIIKKAISLPH